MAANATIPAFDFNAHTELDDPAWLDALYTNLYGGLPDPGGKAYWLGQLQSGTSRYQVYQAGVKAASGPIVNPDYFAFVPTGGFLIGLAILGLFAVIAIGSFAFNAFRRMGKKSSSGDRV